MTLAKEKETFMNTITSPRAGRRERISLAEAGACIQ